MDFNKVTKLSKQWRSKCHESCSKHIFDKHEHCNQTKWILYLYFIFKLNHLELTRNGPEIIIVQEFSSSHWLPHFPTDSIRISQLPFSIPCPSPPLPTSTHPLCLPHRPFLFLPWVQEKCPLRNHSRTVCLRRSADFPPTQKSGNPRVARKTPGRDTNTSQADFLPTVPGNVSAPFTARQSHRTLPV